MSSHDFLENFREMIELIPEIQKAVSIGIQKDLKSHKHDDKRLKIERKFLLEGINILQKKWNVDILYILQFLKQAHFNEIKRAIPKMGSKILTNRLTYLEDKRIVQRIVKTERPLRVIYKLTKFGEGLFKLLLPFIYYIILPKGYLKKIKDIRF